MKAMRVDAMEVGSCFMGTDLTRAHRGLAGGGARGWPGADPVGGPSGPKPSAESIGPEGPPTEEDEADAGTVVGAMESSNAVRSEQAIAVGGVKAMPAVRALAKKLKVDLARVTPSGANGDVTLADVKRAAANPVLAETYGRINARVQSLRFRTNQDAAKWKRAVQEHERMLEALQARDAAALRQVLVAHLEHKRDTVIALLKAGQIYPRTMNE